MLDDKMVEAAQARMASARAGFDSLRSELADLVLPEQSGGFNEHFLMQGRVQTDRQMDSYGAQALQDGVTVFNGFVVPGGENRQPIQCADEAIMADVESLRWLEDVEARVARLRNDPKSGFIVAVASAAASLLAFGEQSTWVDIRTDSQGYFEGLSYQCEHVGGVFVERDAAGNPMRVYRSFRLTAEQADRKWSGEVPPKVREALDANPPRPQAELEFVHVIERNPAVKPGRHDAQGKPWVAGYYSRADKAVFKRGGYRSLRRIVSTFGRSPHEDYGRGPAGRVLPELRSSQVIKQDRTLAIEYGLKRPMLAPDDELDQAVIDLAPWGITYGGLDEMGNPRLKPLFDPPDLSGAESLTAEDRAAIDRAFFRDLLQLNRELKTHISATRTLEEIGEKGILLGPLASQDQEWFAPMLDVELDLMAEAGLLDDMPERIRAYIEAGGKLTSVLDNKVRRMVEALAAAGYLRTAEQVASIAQFDPEAAQAFKREYPLSKVIPGLGRSNGIPAKWQATDDEKASFDDEKQQAAQMDQLLQSAPVIADAAKNAAQAGAIVDGG